MSKRFLTPARIGWGIAGVFAILVASYIAYDNWRYNQPLRIPMVMTITDESNGQVLAEIECYIGHDGDPVWHGTATAYEDGRKLCHGVFHDGRFMTGQWDVGKRQLVIFPHEEFEMKRIISCRQLENTLATVRYVGKSMEAMRQSR